jgi:hypothetical protein
MKKQFLLLSIFMIISGVAFSQKPEMLNKADSLKYGWWDRTTQLGVNLSGSAFSQNWQGGGVNNMVLGGIFANKADYTKGKGVWSNDIQLQLGTITNYSKDNPKETRKNIDRLFLETKYSRSINPKLNWFASANFLSQFVKGYDYSDTKRPIISNLFAPAFLSEGIGLEWKPVKHFYLGLGGATIRQTIVSNKTVENSTYYAGQEKIYGVERGKSVRLEGGFQLVAAYDKNITDRVNLKWRWQTFTPYTLKTFDHNINAIITLKVNKYININGSLIGIYDWDQTGPKGLKPWQLNGGANLGFTLQL